MVVTIAAIPLAWLGWHLQWIRQRRDALDWLSRRDLKATIVNRQTARPDLPWSLAILGEQPLPECVIAPNSQDKANRAAFQQRVADAQRLFPECYLINMEDDN